MKNIKVLKVIVNKDFPLDEQIRLMVAFQKIESNDTWKTIIEEIVERIISIANDRGIMIFNHYIEIVGNAEMLNYEQLKGISNE
jgi:hypothetical protein